MYRDEQAEILFRYLWPGYNDNSINHHVLLIAILITVKTREKLPTWEIFADDPTRFSTLFRRVLAMSLDKSISSVVRIKVLCFFISAFQSLDNGLVRKECAPVVSISIWHNLASEAARERRLEENSQLRKAWRASVKRYEATDEAGRAKLRFERSWLYTLLIDFICQLYQGNQGETIRKSG